MEKLPIGIDAFEKLRTEDSYYMDKILRTNRKIQKGFKINLKHQLINEILALKYFLALPLPQHHESDTEILQLLYQRLLLVQTADFSFPV